VPGGRGGYVDHREAVVAVLEGLADLRGLPLSITVDHGREFEGQVLDAWAWYQNGCHLKGS